MVDDTGATNNLLTYPSDKTLFSLNHTLLMMMKWRHLYNAWKDWMKTHTVGVDDLD